MQCAQRSLRADLTQVLCTLKGAGRAPCSTTRATALPHALGAKRNEIIFTGSGTEADNQALLGAARAFRAARARRSRARSNITRCLRRLEQLESEGFETTLLPGRIRRNGTAGDISRQALRSDTLLASVMYVNNEIGTVQPIADLARIARQRGVLFHSRCHSGAQLAAGRRRRSSASTCSRCRRISSAGPKGIGVLYVREGVATSAPIVHGGGQESGRRAGHRKRRRRRRLGRGPRAGRGGTDGEEPAGRRAARPPRRRAFAPPCPTCASTGRGPAIGQHRQRELCRGRLRRAADRAGPRRGRRLGGQRLHVGRTRAEPRARRPSASIEVLAQGAIRFSLGASTTPLEIERTVLARLVAGLRAPAPVPGEWVDSRRTARGWRQKLEQYRVRQLDSRRTGRSGCPVGRHRRLRRDAGVGEDAARGCG